MSIMYDFFTADWHLFHGRLMEHLPESRPFASLKDMHECMIENHNSIVKPTDHVWILGDITMKGPRHAEQIRKEVCKFNGIKHLVLGNHDRWKPRAYQNSGFLTIHTAMWFKQEDRMFYMMHDPAEYTVIQNDPNAYLLCGHVHSIFKSLLPERRIINVGIDAWDMTPVSFATIMENIRDEKIQD